MEIKLDDNGFIPVICQDAGTGRVLMLGYMTPDALKNTRESGHVWFYSRSRQELWHKGATSGHFMNVQDSWIDCDGDALLLQVHPEGPACHTGNQTCFFTPLESVTKFQYSEADVHILEELFGVIQDRKREMPEGSYTAKLLRDGTGRIAQKVIEEAGEVGISAAERNRDHLAQELADLFFHALVLLADAGLKLDDVWAELRSRRK